MNDRKLDRLLEDAVELLTRASNALPAHLVAMTDASTAWGGSRSYDSPGRRVEHWCDTHEREVHRCHREDLLCSGVPVEVNDRTGEAAIAGDPAGRDRRRLEDEVASVARGAETIVRILAAYPLKARPANELERRATVADNERSDLCALCAAVEVAKNVRVGEPAAQTIILDGEPVSVCRWHADFIRDTGDKPTSEQTLAHHRGQRVRRPA